MNKCILFWWESSCCNLSLMFDWLFTEVNFIGNAGPASPDKMCLWVCREFISLSKSLTLWCSLVYPTLDVFLRKSSKNTMSYQKRSGLNCLFGRVFRTIFLILTLISLVLQCDCFCFGILCGIAPLVSKTCCKLKRYCCVEYQQWWVGTQKDRQSNLVVQQVISHHRNQWYPRRVRRSRCTWSHQRPRSVWHAWIPFEKRWCRVCSIHSSLLFFWLFWSTIKHRLISCYFQFINKTWFANDNLLNQNSWLLTFLRNDSTSPSFCLSSLCMLSLKSLLQQWLFWSFLSSKWMSSWVVSIQDGRIP